MHRHKRMQSTGRKLAHIQTWFPHRLTQTYASFSLSLSRTNKATNTHNVPKQSHRPSQQPQTQASSAHNSRGRPPPPPFPGNNDGRRYDLALYPGQAATGALMFLYACIVSCALMTLLPRGGRGLPAFMECCCGRSFLGIVVLVSFVNKGCMSDLRDFYGCILGCISYIIFNGCIFYSYFFIVAII